MKRRLSTAFLTLALLTPVSALAAAYGSGTYGSGVYGAAGSTSGPGSGTVGTTQDGGLFGAGSGPLVILISLVGAALLLAYLIRRRRRSRTTVED